MEMTYLPKWEQMYQSFLKELSNVKSVNSDILKTASDAIGICHKYITTLKADFSATPGLERDIEIAFFKRIKPGFFSHLIYYGQLFRIELKKPVAAPHVIEEYYLKYLININLFFEDNLEVYQYYRTKSSDKDDQYFTRRPLGEQPVNFSRYNEDPNFTTEHDFTFSKLLGYEMLAEYLQDTMETLKSGVTTSEKTLKWTASKIAFIEIIYAFKAAGVFNNGTATIKTIATHLGNYLGIDPGNTSRSAQELLAREKGLTVFLNHLSTKLLQWSDRLHEI